MRKEILKGSHVVQLLRLADDLLNTGITYSPHKMNGISFIVFMRVCRDYVNPGVCPSLEGEVRQRWLIDRLDRLCLRYFDRHG